VAHRDLVVDQFTKQAVPFSTAPAIRDAEALALLVQFAGAGPDDETLDVACGPGLVVCACAKVVRRATGIDVTPAMIERARAHAAEEGVENVAWQVGDVLPLPYPDATFSLVTSRFAFHHFPDPGAVLTEMARVCRPGGRVLVVDLTASPEPAKADAFNRMERLRDPSHTRALTLAELRALFPAAGLPPTAECFYDLRVDLDEVLARSFPNPGDEQTIRSIFEAAVVDDALGLRLRRKGDRIRFTYAVALLRAPIAAPGGRTCTPPRAAG
jgi:ubiquinone/menaquinone biosynthesis C-methylase UbiE